MKGGRNEKMTMSVNDENSAGAANNNNCSKVDLEHHYEAQGALWPPCPPATGVPAPWNEEPGPTYTPLVKVRLFFPLLIVFSAGFLPPV